MRRGRRSQGAIQVLLHAGVLMQGELGVLRGGQAAELHRRLRRHRDRRERECILRVRIGDYRRLLLLQELLKERKKEIDKERTRRAGIFKRPVERLRCRRRPG